MTIAIHGIEIQSNESIGMMDLIFGLSSRLNEF